MIKTKNVIYLSCLATLFAGLSACGGGGGTSSTTAASTSSPTTYPLQQAYASLRSAGFQQSVNVTGTATVSGVLIPISGALQIAESPASTTTFDGQSAQETSTSVNGTVTAAGQSIAVSDSTNDFVSASGQPLGESSASSYCVVTSYTALPTSINIGASGPFASFICYTDSTMSTELGTSTSTYAVTAGATSDTANVEIIATGSNTEGQPTSSAQTNFQMDAAGNMTFSSITVTTTVEGVTVTYTSTP